MKISSELLSEFFKINIEKSFECDSLGLVDSNIKNSLSFIEDSKYLKQIFQNDNIIVVISKKEFVDKLRMVKLYVIPSDDPKYDFYSLQNYLTKINYKKFDSIINPSAVISPSAYISSTNVIIEKGTIIEPNVTILPDVEIGENCIIRAGAIIGSEGYEHKRTKKGILSVSHDGKVIIKNNVHIGAGSCIQKGFHYRHTIIDEDTKIGDLVLVAHGDQIGKRCLLPASILLSGSVTIGNDVWIGPGSSISNGITIGDNCFISIGSVVTRSLGSGSRVSGNFAIDHEKFIKHIKSIR